MMGAIDRPIAAGMAHEIFISYSSRHRALTETLAAVIEAQHGPGAVWWDHALEARGPYAPQIEAALQAARVVVVLWTAGAQVSEYVYAEARQAHDAGKLVNVLPADTPFAHIPAPFNIHHAVDAADTERLLRDVASAMAGRPVASVLDEALAPIDRDVFRRQIDYSTRAQAQAPAAHPSAPTPSSPTEKSR